MNKLIFVVLIIGLPLLGKDAYSLWEKRKATSSNEGR